MVRLQSARDQLGCPIVISSGYRCRPHNSRVGGAARSKHLQGRAADLVVLPELMDSLESILKIRFPFVKRYEGHFHVHY